MGKLINQLTDLYWSLFYRPDWHDIVDIAIVAFIIYQLLRITRQTRGSAVFRGLLIVLAVTAVSSLLKLRALYWVLIQLINTGAVLLVVLFQPELRRALEQLGRRNFFSRLRHTDDEETEHVIREFVDALTRLSRRKVGALIVLEGKTGMKDVIESGTMLDARISSALLEQIFEPNTPLHDGAVIIRGTSVYAAACILPLTEDTGVSRDLGTRHRAAIGVTETTDATVLVVSEETGVISFAREGRITRYLDAKAITELLRGIYGTQHTEQPAASALRNVLKWRPGK